MSQRRSSASASALPVTSGAAVRIENAFPLGGGCTDLANCRLVLSTTPLSPVVEFAAFSTPPPSSPIQFSLGRGRKTRQRLAWPQTLPDVPPRLVT